MYKYLNFLWLQYNDPNYNPEDNTWTYVRIEDMQTSIFWLYDNYPMDQQQFLLDLNEYLYTHSWDWKNYYLNRFPTGDIGVSRIIQPALNTVRRAVCLAMHELSSVSACCLCDCCCVIGGVTARVELLRPRCEQRPSAQVRRRPVPSQRRTERHRLHLPAHVQDGQIPRSSQRHIQLRRMPRRTQP